MHTNTAWFAARAGLAAVTLIGAALVGFGGLPVAAAEGQPGSGSIGPKTRIAVARFEASPALTNSYKGWDVGGDLAAQLATELVKTGRFIVVERALLGDILREGELATRNGVSSETAPQAGRLLGAQVLITGAVTEFTQVADGGGVRIGASGFGKILDRVWLGLELSTGRVALDLRLVDATTGQVLQSHRSEARVSGRGVSLEIDTRSVSFGGDAFNQTPLGAATRQAIREAVTFATLHMARIPWTGRVVDVIEGRVYLNVGGEAGAKVGDAFIVAAVKRELIDPATGLSLGTVEAELGEVRVEAVHDKFAIARSLGDYLPRRGDVVRPKANGA